MAAVSRALSTQREEFRQTFCSTFRSSGPIKISRLRICNHTSRKRRLSVTAYAEWTLGQSRAASAPFVITEVDEETGALFARNAWNSWFARGVAFADLSGRQSSWTGDRGEFIGRNGTLAEPAGLAGSTALSGHTGAGLDPCAALGTVVTLAPGEETEVTFLLGEADGVDQAREVIREYRTTKLDAKLRQVGEHWEQALDVVRVRTPDRAMDILLNGWLLYQTIACRIHARSAFYQASGAYGFRDQLQDGMAIAGARPELTRAHILRAAGRQFVEGDVQHWWLPHSGQGVRTRISDDRAWLAYATAHYIEVSGDSAILDEEVSFIEGPRLAPNEHDSFFAPGVSERTASIFEHCALALDNSLAVGTPRPALDGRRRLERRHEPCRRARQRRERLARLVPLCGAFEIYPACRGSRRIRTNEGLAGPCRRSQDFA